MTCKNIEVHPRDSTQIRRTFRKLANQSHNRGGRSKADNSEVRTNVRHYQKRWKYRYLQPIYILKKARRTPIELIDLKPIVDDSIVSDLLESEQVVNSVLKHRTYQRRDAYESDQ